MCVETRVCKVYNVHALTRHQNTLHSREHNVILYYTSIHDAQPESIHNNMYNVHCNTLHT